jgi:dTMP kinase
MHTKKDLIKGKLITFEGIDGAGKTSIVRNLPAHLTACQAPIITCGERRSPFSELLRNSELKGMTALLKIYLFAADRAWTYEKECLPALKSGALVLWDRYVDSALAYRAVELSLKPETLSPNLVKQINRPFRTADVTFFVDIRIAISDRRTRRKSGTSPYTTEFLRRVRIEYERLARHKRYIIIDGELPLESVTETVARHIRGRFKELFCF